MPINDSNSTKNCSVIVITVDGLGARYLGAYGNDWRQSPNLDRWAAAGLLLEMAMTNRPGEWLDRLPLLNEAPPTHEPQKEVPGDANSQHLRRILITDDPQVVDAAELRFDEVQLVELSPADEAVSDWTETQTAMFFADAAAAIESMDGPQLLWIHSRGFQNAWDAPQDWRQDLVGEDDPDPPEWIVPPLSEFSPVVDAPSIDPDIRWGWLQCYGAQLRVIDQCLGMLFELIEARWLDGQSILTLCYSTQGYPLGEHGIVGHQVPNAFDETLHVPLIIRDHSQRLQGQRRLSLVNVRDAYEWIQEWLKGTSQDFVNRWPLLPSIADSNIVGRVGDCHFIRTLNWKWIGQCNRDQLYSKPDDRWEQNDVSGRCPEVVLDFRQRSPLVSEG